MSHDLVLDGCRRQPLADYLKGLGVFRLVSEQVDPGARAWWSGGVLRLRSSLDRAALLEYFATSYAPTPIVAPWNGGSGFYAKDVQDGIRAIEQSSSGRFDAYRRAIAVCRELVASAGLTERPDAAGKQLFLEQVRALLSDDALRWVDAAVALEEDGPAYPPLLGTGGNDGRLDFSNNQMQRLAELLIDSDGSKALLESSLFALPAPRLSRAAIGQFRPTSAGGANAGEGFDRDSLVNPWDYVLALEGAMVFAVALTRRIESSAPGALSFPFTVRASGVGYGSAARSDESDARAEMWLPLWSRPASYDEIRTLFGEGRATVGTTRAARTGVDFARAIAALGVDRGIDEFSRIGFLVRNGLAYFATPLGEWTVSPAPKARLLADLDDWLVRLARAVGPGKNAPSALRRAAARVDDSILELCRRGDSRSVGDLLIAIGGVESVCAHSPASRDLVRPLPALSARWFAEADDGTPELKLAAALAAGNLRGYMSPAVARGSAYAWGSAGGDLVWSERSLVDSLIAVARRRASKDGWPALDGGRRAGGVDAASAADLVAFLAGTTDDARLEKLVWGMCSIAWHDIPPPPPPPPEDRFLPAAFALCRLALVQRPTFAVELPRTPGIVGRLASGDSAAATQLAIRRLRGAGLLPRCGPIEVSPATARRAAAALVFPIDRPTIAAVLRQLVRNTSLEDLYHDAHRS